MKIDHSDIYTSDISAQRTKDIQILFTAFAVIAFILFSFNFQALAGGKDIPSTPASPLPFHTASISDFSKLDMDHDGQLTPNEVKGDETLERSFKVIDTDVNGTIDKNEYSVFILTSSPN